MAKLVGIFAASHGPIIARDWETMPRDHRAKLTAGFDEIGRRLKTGSIILEHDGGGNRAQTVAALKIVLPRLLAAGYRFTTP